MKIYLVIHEDRHTDVEVEAFSDKEKSIEYARKRAKSCVHEDYLEDYQESDILGWLFFASYSGVGDSVRVIEVELDKELGWLLGN